MHYRLFSPHNCIATIQYIKMLQLSLSMYLSKNSKIVEFMSQPSPPLPAETNPLVK